MSCAPNVIWIVEGFTCGIWYSRYTLVHGDKYSKQVLTVTVGLSGYFWKVVRSLVALYNKCFSRVNHEASVGCEIPCTCHYYCDIVLCSCRSWGSCSERRRETAAHAAYGIYTPRTRACDVILVVEVFTDRTNIPGSILRISLHGASRYPEYQLPGTK